MVNISEKSRKIGPEQKKNDFWGQLFGKVGKSVRKKMLLPSGVLAIAMAMAYEYQYIGIGSGSGITMGNIRATFGQISDNFRAKAVGTWKAIL